MEPCDVGLEARLAISNARVRVLEALLLGECSPDDRRVILEGLANTSLPDRPQCLPHVLRMKPYQPGPSAEIRELKSGRPRTPLGSNENLFGASPLARQAYLDAVSGISRYPDPDARLLKAKLAALHGISADEIVIGNGSDELLKYIVEVFARQGFDNIVDGGFAFIAYKVRAQANDIEIRNVPFNGLHYDLDAMLDQIDSRTKVIFIANPNNPTGTYIKRDELISFLKRVPPYVMVVLDEAYVDYIDEGKAPECPNGLELRNTREGLILLRTFSKAYGLAGLRAGYAIMPKHYAEVFNRPRLPFGVNRIAIATATAALDDPRHIEFVREVTSIGREEIRRGLEKLGVKCPPSVGNFLCVPVPCSSARAVADLDNEEIIVRDLTPYGLPHRIRVTVGSVIHNRPFLAAFSELLPSWREIGSGES